MLAKIEIEIICPECHNLGETSGKFKNKKCFYNPEKDIWHCYHCGAKGRGDPTVQSLQDEPKLHIVQEFQFTEELLKAYQDELAQSEDGLTYLARRLGSEIDPIGKFGLGWDPANKRIVIPVRNEIGQLVGVKYRRIDSDQEPKYISEPGSKAGFFYLTGSSESVLVVEGEFDAMAAKVLGFEGQVVAVQTNRMNDVNKDRLRNLADVIYVAADNDEAGEILLNAVMRISPYVREVKLPTKDVGELIELQGIQKAKIQFTEAIAAAKTYVEQESYSVFERLHETQKFLTNVENIKGWSTGYKALDDCLGGGLLPHTLTAVSAPGKGGKTSFLLNLIYNLIVRNEKVAFLSLEMSPITYCIPTLLSIAFQTNARDGNTDKLNNIIKRAPAEMPHLANLTFMDRYGSTPSAYIDTWIRQQYELHGIRTFVLDHVGYSLLDIKDPAEHSALSKALRSITRDLPVHILAIVQPKQLAKDQKYVTKHDLYGSVTWSQDVNQLITLEVNPKEQRTIIRLAASHWPLAKPSEDGIILFYDPDTCTLRE